MNDPESIQRPAAKRRVLWILGILAGTICCPLGGLLYLGLALMDDADSDDCRPDPRIALFTPVDGPLSGRKLTVKVADEADKPIPASPRRFGRTAIEPEGFPFDTTLRPATLPEVEALGLPFLRTFSTDWGPETLFVSVTGKTVSIRKETDLTDVRAEYSLHKGELEFLGTTVFGSSSCD